ncbi:hypothetical protein FB45DRAFT_1002917 [Roridomyces roridus]|uniref:Uncharacterized protein n=1 Tax=Roridomyces roridus TaxID=1738132 RepID=A0AAD7FM97_9AGAR|nr:hypothetical protein FB45DRAFT_1002917 [Roridomyces roridus]
MPAKKRCQFGVTATPNATLLLSASSANALYAELTFVVNQQVHARVGEDCSEQDGDSLVMNTLLRPTRTLYARLDALPWPFIVHFGGLEADSPFGVFIPHFAQLTSSSSALQALMGHGVPFLDQLPHSSNHPAIQPLEVTGRLKFNPVNDDCCPSDRLYLPLHG